jgi:hypothetical protein
MRLENQFCKLLGIYFFNKGFFKHVFLLRVIQKSTILNIFIDKMREKIAFKIIKDKISD